MYVRNPRTHRSSYTEELSSGVDMYYNKNSPEVSVSESYMSSFSNEDSIQAKLRENEEPYEYILLKEALLNELYKVIDEALTERQAEILSLVLEGLTQREVAEKLNITQASVSMTLHGAKTKYKHSDARDESYGGIYKKLKKACKKNPKIQEILAEIQALKSAV